MFSNRLSILEQIRFKRLHRFLSRVSGRAPTLPLGKLRNYRTRLRGLRRKIDRALHIADGRLTLPLIGSNSFAKPLNTDWAHRPEIWRGPIRSLGRSSVASRTMFGEDVTLFHDCNKSELTVRQVRNTLASDLAPFGLSMDVFTFSGSFLSITVNLPDSVCDRLTKSHVIRLSTAVSLEKPIEIFARMNIQHGPNREQIIRELPLNEDVIFVEFDLAYSKINENRLERVWVDLIFENPEMSQIVLRDLTFSRRPRAEY